MTHWHDENPYAENIAYVPIEELAACCAGGSLALRDGSIVAQTPERILAHWRESGARLDAYVLLGGDRHLSADPGAGVRYGPGPGDYISPLVKDRERFAAMVEESLVPRGPRH